MDECIHVPGFSEPVMTAASAGQHIRAGAQLLDVRTLREFQSGALPNALHIPHDEIATRIDALADLRDQVLLVYCKMGSRSDVAVAILKQAGFERVYNIGGYEQVLTHCFPSTD